MESRAVLKKLKTHYKLAKCALDHKNPWQLLIATMLSAQCTDERVNMVTPVLFSRFKSAKELAKANIREVEKLVYSTGFYKNKARNIVKASKAIAGLGKFPDSMEVLSALPGVGRKTANVVLANAFNQPAIVVDTHVTRLVNRLGFAEGKNAEILERKLMTMIDKKDWIMFSHYLIAHGRAVCTARKPLCGSCFLSKLCPKIGI